MIEELKDVMELATGTTALIGEVLKLKNNNKKGADKENLIKVSKGDYAKIGSSGNYAKIGSSGYYAQIGSSGYYAQIDSTGEKAVISAIGYKSYVKGIIGTWITLAEYKEEINRFIINLVKTEQIDGIKLKENTYYTLYNGEFTEVQIIDEVPTIILKSKKGVKKGLFLNTLVSCYVVEKDGLYSHGKTLKDAKENLKYKISNRDTTEFEKYTLNDELDQITLIKMYRTITGACVAGTRNFCETHKLPKKCTIRKAIELTEGQYGNNRFREFFERSWNNEQNNNWNQSKN